MNGPIWQAHLGKNMANWLCSLAPSRHPTLGLMWASDFVGPVWIRGL